METERKNLFRMIKEFGGKCARVLRVARKPTGNEVKQISKVSALGMLIIGLIGFIVSLVLIFLK